jgi:hypothetical protein
VHHIVATHERATAALRCAVSGSVHV